MKKGMRVRVFDEDHQCLVSAKLMKKLWSRISTDKNGYRWRKEKWLCRLWRYNRGRLVAKVTFEPFEKFPPKFESAVTGEGGGDASM
jgi:hypothetical protein